MRCVDVIRELAAPTGGPGAQAAHEHLARCPSCADWADRAARFDRLWDATRPTEPSPSACEATWARITESIDHAPAIDRFPFRSPPARSWRHAATAVFAIAQAAAILFVVLAIHPGQRPRKEQVPGPSIEIAEGQPVLIHKVGQDLHVDSLVMDETTNMVDANFVMFNTLEAMAE